MEQTFTRAERLKALEATLYRARGGLSATEIAQRLGVHRSTAYRDLRSLLRSGAPVWTEAGRFCLLKDGYLGTIRLDLNESLALYLAARLLAAHSDEHNPHVVRALHKLAGAVPQPMSDHMQKTAALAGRRQAAESYVAVLETLTRAWADSRQVDLTYRGPHDDDPTRRVFDTWFIEPSATGYACYAIGFDHLRQALRTFKVERIERATLLDSTYEIDPDFDPHDYLAGAWRVMGGGDLTPVRLRFGPSVAYRVRETCWPGLVEVTECPGGGCDLLLNVAHTLELKPWIRSWGPDCEVLEPQGLRREVAEEMARAAARYEAARATVSSDPSTEQPER